MLKLAASRRPSWSVARPQVVIGATSIMAPKDKKAGQQARSVHYSSHLRVMNIDNSTAAPSVLLLFDKHRYLFNAGEGIQRHFIEHKQRLSKVTHVLATRVHTDTLAGLPGMLLSQVQPGAECGKNGGPAVTALLHGPPGLSGYVDAFRIYATSFGLSVNEIGTGSNDTISAENRVTITPLLIRAAPSSSSSKPQPAAAAAAAEEADGSQEPATKKPRHDTAAEAANGTAAAAAAAGSGGSSGRGMASVHSSAGVQSAVVCYVCQLATIPGKFDPQKASQLGVPRGPLYGELQRGTPVTAVNGRTIQPHEVMSTPTTPGPCIVIIDCPSLDYLPALQAQQALQQLQQECQQQQQQQQQQQEGGVGSAAAAGEGAGQKGSSGSGSEAAPRKRFIVIHMGPTAVSRSAEYRAWCAGFGYGADQMFLSRESQLCTTTLRAAQLQAQLNVIEPEVFPLQGFMDLKQQQQGAAGTASSEPPPAAAAAAAGGQGMDCPDGLVFTLVPARQQGITLDTAVTQAPDFDTVQAEVRDNHPKVMQLLQDYAAAKAAAQQQQEQQPVPQLQGIDRQTVALTPLGTCSACPSNHRNVSSYYLDLFDKGGLLMDCGEDSMGQLERRYGRAEADRRIMQLHAVWVSHMHADHHGGLYPLLLRRQALLEQQRTSAQAAAAAAAPDTADGRDQAAAAAAAAAAGNTGRIKPLLILGPFPLFRVLCQYSKVLPLAFTFLPNHFFFSPSARQPPAEAVAAYEAVKAAAGLSQLQPFPVQHVSNSSGLQVQSESGWKVVFSGDTRPCQAVIDAAKDATLLVHEATFEDELQDEAIAKKHSTTAEALGVAAAAGAYRTLLTHFSTRYPRIPVMKPPAAAEGGAEGGNSSDLAAVGSVLVGFDFMTVNFADLAWMPQMLPVLDELFKEEEAAYMDDDAEGGEGAEGAEHL